MSHNIENLTLLSDLESIEVSLENLFINPNNPRLMGKDRFENVKDSRVIEDKVQESIIKETKIEGITDIVEKIKRLGFLTIDRIVIRELDGHPGKYVVLEGNRRITSCKILLDEHNRSVITLNDKVLMSLESIEALVYTGSDKDILWLLQGIRHINGIKEWGSLQQSRFLYEMQKEESLRATELDKMTGLGRNTISNKIRSYKGYLNARDFYHGEITEDNFSLFQEVIFARPIIKSWLGWDDSKESFSNEGNLEYILNWYLGDEVGNRRIKRAVELRDFLNQVLIPENKKFLQKFINSEEYSVKEALQDISTKDAYKSAQKNQLDLEERLEVIEEVTTSISTLPTKKIIDDGMIEVYIEKLKNLSEESLFQVNTLNRVSRSE